MQRIGLDTFAGGVSSFPASTDGFSQQQRQEKLYRPGLAVAEARWFVDKAWECARATEALAGQQQVGMLWRGHAWQVAAVVWLSASAFLEHSISIGGIHDDGVADNAYIIGAPSPPKHPFAYSAAAEASAPPPDLPSLLPSSTVVTDHGAAGSASLKGLRRAHTLALTLGALAALEAHSSLTAPNILPPHQQDNVNEKATWYVIDGRFVQRAIVAS
jgi:hypothetical protein